MNCRRYYIPDLTNDNSKLKLIFVLESPYSDEVIHNHPVACTSGLSMSRLLHDYFPIIKKDVPLGCQIKNKDIINIGVINCSKFPLDKSVYECWNLSLQIPLNELDTIRKNPKSKTRRQIKLQSIHNILLRNFKKRVKSIVLRNSSVLFIPCGELARNFIEECGLDNDNIYLKRIPHPSRNQWSKEENFEDYYHFIDIVETTLNGS